MRLLADMLVLLPPQLQKFDKIYAAGDVEKVGQKDMEEGRGQSRCPPQQLLYRCQVMTKL